ncbi:hypothetical protein HDF24_23485 [Mucilaginibacter sp. X4EP1]|uniref:hypothetical protein n=1 Tax=Mucilaginibacter sp. X4EP1 TaxID=2723092 RepID=UPI0021696840|nr:hypothetical protein [Mucilaginibacter sp. X4EP1]MCS3815896.1 hypothetical protein [Mucilaginibacter sp. X4EP1]
MKQFKKVLRVAGMIMLITLASVGVGITGGIPVPSNRRKDNSIEIKTELKETDENESGNIRYEDCL